jgi:hypothetical protein
MTGSSPAMTERALNCFVAYAPKRFAFVAGNDGLPDC